MDVDPSLPTARFRRQHMELASLAEALTQWTLPQDVAANAQEVSRRLARFIGVLKVHAAMEEQALYPRLLSSMDAEVAARARKLLEDVGPIYAQMFAFTDRWSSAGSIERAPADFIAETRAAMKTLSRRVTRETMELYPLADAAGTA